jgi:hypothetical protein
MRAQVVKGASSSPSRHRRGRALAVARRRKRPHAPHRRDEIAERHESRRLDEARSIDEARVFEEFESACAHIGQAEATQSGASHDFG